MDIRCKTSNDISPKGKPRVYFTCHPDDFSRYFPQITDDLFRVADCAVYYTADLSEPIAPEALATDIGSNNLLVVPVTRLLLTQPCRAMEVDIPYARQEQIPILPILVEKELDPLYSQPDKFGDLQYLSPIIDDRSQISYEEKLRKYLESVLFSDALAQQIRETFDAYIFLSYRKKDRRYANSLMRLIHNNPRYRDVAIWYDEFLTPGEDFRENIANTMHSSKLFALVVTPNLLEEPEGQPNYVMGTEYPTAQSLGMPILPAEMEPTDRDMLAEKFPRIPDCVYTKDTESFRARLTNALEQIDLSSDKNDPARLYYIGLAYLMGIDVEVDRRRGWELIVAAAEQDFPDAMDKLFCTFRNGIGVQPNYAEAARWALRLVNFFETHCGPEDYNTLLWKNNLAAAYGDLGKDAESLALQEQIYPLMCKTLGQTHPNTLTALNNLAAAYYEMSQYSDALSLLEQAYDLLLQTHGAEDEATLAAMSNLAQTYGKLRRYEEANKLMEEVCAVGVRIWGPDHPSVIAFTNNLAVSYSDLGMTQQAIDLFRTAYEQRCRVLGETHPDTLNTLSNLAACYTHKGEHKTALELCKKLYPQQCQAQGELHPQTLCALWGLAECYQNIGKYARALKLLDKLYAQRRQVLGQAHPDTLRALDALGSVNDRMGRHADAIVQKDTLYTLRKQYLGPDHPDTLQALRSLSVMHFNGGSPKDALPPAEQYYKALLRLYGAEHPKTVQAKKDMERLRTYI